MSRNTYAPEGDNDYSNLLSEIRELLRSICAALESPNSAECLRPIFDHLHLCRIGQPASDREWYTVAELAEKVNRKRYTVQTWCWRGRVKAEKAQHGRGIDKEWRISHEEYLRYRREGLLKGRPRD
jgi:hypothetical protein